MMGRKSCHVAQKKMRTILKKIAIHVIRVQWLWGRSLTPSEHSPFNIFPIFCHTFSQTRKSFACYCIKNEIGFTGLVLQGAKLNLPPKRTQTIYVSL